MSPAPLLRVGALVTVARASGVNSAHARAIVVEQYEIEDRPGWTLLFADGRADGFSPSDCDLFGVRVVGYLAAHYQFRSLFHHPAPFWDIWSLYGSMRSSDLRTMRDIFARDLSASAVPAFVRDHLALIDAVFMERGEA